MSTFAEVGAQPSAAADETSLQDGHTQGGWLQLTSSPPSLSTPSSSVDSALPPAPNPRLGQASQQAEESDNHDQGEYQLSSELPLGAVATSTPTTGTPENIWDYSLPVPDSKDNQLIYLKAPFEWGDWSAEQLRDRFVFVKNELEALVYKYLRLRDSVRRPGYYPRMVGTCLTDARPAVVVTCQEADLKNIRTLFRDRAEGPLYLGDSSTNSHSLLPPFGRRVKRAESIPRLLLVYYPIRTRSQ